MDDHLACAELCERNGFDRQAAFFDSIYGRQGRAYMVMKAERGFYLEYGPPDGGIPQGYFLDPVSAGREAERRNRDFFRDIDRTRQVFNRRFGTFQTIRYSCDPRTGVKPGEFSFPIWLSEVLGIDYEASDGFEDRLREALRSAGDEAMRELMGRDEVRFYYFVGVELFL